MLSNLVHSLKNSLTQKVNPFNVRGYASTSKDLDDKQVDLIKSTINNSALCEKITLENINKSSLTSYFTPEYIIRPLCKLTSYLGVKGRMLEPSCGNGRFIEHAQDLDLEITGVELDPVMGYLARSTYPSADIRLGQRFEEANLDTGTFSLILGNPPYGNIRPQANTKDYGNINIMGYFVLRGLEMLHSGGFEVFVLSTWFLDSAVNDGREVAARLGQLALALRLPNGCFSTEGSDLPVDILIFKREYMGDVTEQLDELANNAHSWRSLTERVEHGQAYKVNSFFVKNPECVLGTLTPPASIYRSCEVKSDMSEAEIESKIVELGKKYLAKNSFEDTYKKEPIILEQSKNALKYRFNELYLDGIDIKQRKHSIKDENGLAIAQVINYPHAQTVNKLLKNYLALKTVYFNLVNSEYNNNESDVIEALREELNVQYNDFIAAFGPLNRPINKRRLKDCSQYIRIAGLERNYEPENKKEGIKESYQAAELLSKRVFCRKQLPTKADTPHEALTISLMEHGTLNIARVASLLNMTEADALKTLQDNDLAFDVPNEGYISAVEYLHGNIKEKIDALQNEPKYNKNLIALTKVLPKRVISTDINIPFGAVWVPTKFYTDFITYLNAGNEVFKVSRTDRFHVTQKKYQTSIHTFESVQWGFDCYPASNIISSIINGKNPVVYTTNADGERVVDTNQTMTVQSKADEIKEEFQNWILEDIDRRTELEDIYNDTFNVFARRDLSCISKYLYVDNCTLTPFDYQLETAVFALLNNGTMIDIPMGGGKSLIYQIFINLIKKLDPTARPAIVMPNSLVGQFTIDYMRNFPMADLIVLDNELTKEKREEILQNAANNSFDALIMPITTFQSLEAPKNVENELLENMISELEKNIESNNGDRISTYRLEKKKENLESNLKELKRGALTKSGITFNDLNIDILLQDEVQSIKNVPYSTTYTGIRGMGTAKGSKVAYDAYIKTKSVLDAGGKVVFGTGTVLTNTVLELRAWLMMLAPEIAKTGLHNVDDFLTMFSQPVTDYSIDSTGRSFKQFTSIKKFTNLPELASIYSTFAYSMSQEELNDRLPRLENGKPRIPPLKNGKVETVILDISDEQDEIFENLVEQAAHLTKKRNMLAIMHDAKSASLDQRLFDPSLPESPNNVINTAVKRILEIHNDALKKGIHGNQLVFCDKGIPSRHKASEKKHINALIKAAKAGDQDAIALIGGKTKNELFEELSTSFSVYDELEKKLVDAGLRVAIIHDHSHTRKARNDLQKAFNSGQLDILIGSSYRMGAGWNLNRRLLASYDFDLPLTPGALQQRWGRIRRQSNSLYENGLIDSVQIITFCTKRTLDSWSADLLHRKSQMFSTFARTMNKREIEPDNEIISLDELTAIVADNELMLERVKLLHEINTIKAQKRAFEYRLHGYQQKWKDMSYQMPLTLRTMKQYKADLAVLKNNPDQIFLNTDGTEINYKKLNKLIADHRFYDVNMKVIAKSNDFEIKVEYNINGFKAYLVGNATYLIGYGRRSKAVIENALNILQNIEYFDNKEFDKICLMYKEKPKVEEEIKKTFDDKGLPSKIARLKEINLVLIHGEKKEAA